MKTLFHKNRWLAVMAKTALSIAFAGLLGGTAFGQVSSCPQLSGETTYDRSINGPVQNSSQWLQADYNKTTDRLYIGNTYNSTTGTDPWLSEVQGNSVINWSRRYPFSGNEQILASKKMSNGDEVIAGSTMTASGMHLLFVEDLSSTGTFNWVRYFVQANTDLNSFVVIAESRKNKDIIVATSANSLANDLVLVRLTNTGTLLYYEDHPIFAAGNTVEHYPTISGITSTSDDGYVIVGHTGHNWDFYAATVMKYDANYNVSGTHAMNWKYVYRHKLLVTYDLTTAGHRSSTFARGVCEDPASGKIIVVGRTGDNDQYGTSTTYQNGFVLTLSAAGTLPTIKNYVPANGHFLNFEGVNMSGSNYVITGSDQTPVSFSYQTLVLLVNASTFATSWAYTYGTGGLDIGYSIFPRNSTIGGYLSVGITNDNGTTTLPQLNVLALDANGQIAGCYNAVSIPTANDVNDQPTLTLGPQTGATMVSTQTNTINDCEVMYAICGPGCPQLTPKTHYSRAINDNFNTSWLQADYDHGNNNTLVPSTYSGLGPMFWSNVALNSSINFSNHYSLNGTENTLAIKKASNGDVLIAGFTYNGVGNDILYVMRTNATGSVIWYKNLYQTNTDLRSFVTLTESSINHDVIVASSANSLANDIVLARFNSSGTMLYYDDHAQYAAGNTVEHYPNIQGITATNDDGYVVVGNTGHNWDFYAATVLKYDANYNTTFNHVMNWNYVYRHKLAGGIYDLTTPGDRSATFAHGVIEEPATSNIVVVGWQADNDQYGTNATYQNGFALQLQPNGTYINHFCYVNQSGYFMSLNGVTIDGGGDYETTGSVLDPNTGQYQILIMKIASSTLIPVWAELYGSNGNNIGYSIFTTPNGFVSVNLSNDNTVSLQPHLLSVDGSGHAGLCYTDLAVYTTDDKNDQPTLTVGSQTSANPIDQTPLEINICEAMVDLCGSATRPMAEAGINAPALKNGMVNMYPNPVASMLNVDLAVDKASKGRVVVKDVLGNDVMTKTVTMIPGTNQYELDIASIKAGVYFIQVVNDNNTVYPVTKIQKN